ncbi:hypothetical protein RvY_10302 [Ramazzottius varieornatus]|uniref:Uncharacterized protein n=1 Tax=Ramazzottius varieornatus TaxID=947166 RepID=A0A1D1VCB8_RAMVA|nr:hypothetical protein RvY_10302 [Ramazzottius varieornatus]
MDGSTWLQASLPVSIGGLGIRRTERIALPAFMASIHPVQALVRSIYPGSDLDSLVNGGLDQWPLVTALRRRQRAWDLPMVTVEFGSLMDQSDMTSKARLMAVSTKTSGTWLHALPVSSLGNLLDDNTLRISFGLRLGSRLCQPHMCRCGEVVDQYGLHGLSCLKSAGRHSRHASLNESVRRALFSAQVPAVVEPLGRSRDDGLRPDGKTMIPWKNGEELAWDVTVVDTLAKSYVGKTSEIMGAAAEDAEERNIQKYQGIASQCLFVPLGFETFGSWRPAATELINAIGKKLVEAFIETSGDSKVMHQVFGKRLADHYCLKLYMWTFGNVRSAEKPFNPKAQDQPDMVEFEKADGTERHLWISSETFKTARQRVSDGRGLIYMLKTGAVYS